MEPSGPDRTAVGGPELATEPPRVETGSLDPGADHAAAHRVGGERGTDRRIVPIIEQPCTCKPQHGVQGARFRR
ncbi:hypothetical protein Amsp01_100550 [Amycolatopsis sp. NBRC 101858]|nr:hypothetical protein Amsp01_100550 [Amycolatopsis sp. NBRC 101858]